MGSTLQGVLYRQNNTLDIVQHVVVPKADHPIAAGFEVCGSLMVVAFLLQMLAPAQFEDEFLLDAEARVRRTCPTDKPRLADELYSIGSIPFGKVRRTLINRYARRPRVCARQGWDCGAVLWHGQKLWGWCDGAFRPPPNLPHFKERKWGRAATFF